MRPRPVGDLFFVKATHRCLYGMIVSEWKNDGGSFHWNISIPPNTTATVYVPAKDETTVTEGGLKASEVKGVKYLRMEGGAAVYTVGSGNYSFASPD
jgi:alpha-L-rhamnosidase